MSVHFFKDMAVSMATDMDKLVRLVKIGMFCVLLWCHTHTHSYTQIHSHTDTQTFTHTYTHTVTHTHSHTLSHTVRFAMYEHA